MVSQVLYCLNGTLQLQDLILNLVNSLQQSAEATDGKIDTSIHFVFFYNDGELATADHSHPCYRFSKWKVAAFASRI